VGFGVGVGFRGGGGVGFGVGVRLRGGCWGGFRGGGGVPGWVSGWVLGCGVGVGWVSVGCGVGFGWLAGSGVISDGFGCGYFFFYLFYIAPNTQRRIFSGAFS
jgi:hypothetical protein